jgi:cellulose synthase (UDP-forming)
MQIKESFPMAYDAAPAFNDQLKEALYYLLAIGLGILALTGIVLTGRDALPALTSGWEDMVTPITAELKHGQQVNYGVYDFGHRKLFAEAKGVAIEHIFVSWLSSESSETISHSYKYANDRNRWLMITIEPFAADGRDRYRLLDDVVAGAYDSSIASVCRSIGSLQSSVFVRWGHEMERSDERYPWSGANGNSYITAYRHFAARCRADAPKVLLVWSPRGDPGLADYYPGQTYVDLVGLSLYALPAYDLEHFGKVLNFRDAFTPKYNRAMVFNKRMMITEMGVSGDTRHQAAWMANFFRSLKHFPLLRTVVYFNATDSAGAWPEKYGTPVWNIDPNIFE